VPATVQLIAEALARRAATGQAVPIEPALVRTKPALSTEAAEAIAPRMTRLSTHTTWFLIGEKNAFGANIWLPATFIDGTVLAPGETFDFWKIVGPVTRERGFGLGGAIINGRTEPQGALAGGICSSSTTIFNAALKAGLQMGDRRNHYYYIDRYPLGLDATVFISASGSVQNMTFTNDTGFPILIRGINSRKGNIGYTRFDIYGVETGRTVTFSTPIVKNVRPATTVVEYTPELPAGARRQVEFPVDGMDVWVTRTVRGADGTVLHTDTFYSHYARITGIVQIGTGGAAAPSPSPSPALES
jgi:vancomycin resistance protein YoaR